MDEAETKKEKKPIKRPVVLAASALLLLAMAVTLVLLQTGGSSPFPKKIREQVTYSLYYPSKAPSGWKVEKSSIAAGDQSVTYQVIYDDSDKFVVSVQPIPANFDFAAFKKKFYTTDEFTTDIGTVLVGEVGSSLIASIRTSDGSWILINTSYYASQAKLTELARYFVKTDN